MSPDLPRRHVLALAAAVGSGGLAGCLSTASTLRAPAIDGSQIFKSIKTSESWSSNKISASIGLTSAATTQHGVRGLVVISSSGSDFWTKPVDVSQTSVSGSFPTSGPATLAATNYDDQFVERLQVEISTESLIG
jgi:hypothetical protein